METHPISFNVKSNDNVASSSSFFTTTYMLPLLFFSAKPNLPLGFFRRSHELPDRVEDNLKLRVISLFHVGKFPGKIFMGCEHLPKTNECSDNIDAHCYCLLAIQDSRCHYSAVFGENPRQEPRIAVLLGTGRKLRPVRFVRPRSYLSTGIPFTVNNPCTMHNYIRVQRCWLQEILEPSQSFSEILPGQQSDYRNSICCPLKDGPITAYPQAIEIPISFEFLDMLSIRTRIYFKPQASLKDLVDFTTGQIRQILLCFFSEDNRVPRHVFLSCEPA